MTRMRKRKKAIKAVRYGLLGLSVGLLVVLGLIFIGDAKQDPAAREAERVQSAQERVQEVTPNSVPAAPAQQ